MKKSILFVFATFLTIQLAHAQGSSFFVGGNGGANLSMYGFTSDYADLWTTSRPKPGLNGGVVFGAEFNRMAIVSGINFIQKGSKAETDNYQVEGGYVGYVRGRENTSFIQVPMLFRYRFLSEKFGITAAAGPSFNVGLAGNARLELEVAGVGSRSQSSTIRFGNGINDNYKRFQPGFILSPGMLMQVGEKGKLAVNIIWDLGFNAVNPRSSQAAGLDGKISNISTILNVSYTHHFTFGDKY